MTLRKMRNVHTGEVVEIPQYSYAELEVLWKNLVERMMNNG